MTDTKSNKPTHAIYSVQGEGEKAHWTRIGAAWPHKDGNGFSISLDCIPLNGRIQMRIPTEAEKGGAQ